MSAFTARVPGLALAVAVAAVATALAAAETRVLGHPVVDALVIAILLGMIVRAALPRAERFAPGIDFAAKEVLEVAVFLLGASVDLAALVRAGPALAAGVLLLVVLGLAAAYGIARALGLPHTLALLVGCGNAICGNSAIAAVAPAIGAPREHVASAIAFTAVLGVVAVIGLPLLMGPLGYSERQFGVLVGLTVYAVPQVLAAALPVGVVAGQMATLVKLARVLLLGPVVLVAALSHAGRRADAPKLRWTQVVPWFVVGFALLAAARTMGWIGDGPAGAVRSLSHQLTLLAMAALGLAVDLHSMRRVGPKVAATAALSLLALVGIAVALVRALHLG